MGYAVVSTVLAGAASFDLIDIAAVKDELSLAASDTSNDAWLSRAITQVSKGLATNTNRVFPPELVRDAFDIQQDAYPYQTPGGFPQLELSRYPLLGVVSVVQTLAGGATPTTQTLVEGTDFTVDLATGRLLRLNPFTGVGTAWEAVPVTVIYTAGYGALVAESHTVPSSPFTVTIGKSATFSCPQSVSYAGGAPLALVAANPSAGQYALTGTPGQFQFAAADAGQALAFVYATLAVPDDLAELVLRLITARFWSKDRDPALIQQETPGVGTQRWWFGGAPGQKGPYSPDVEAALDRYRMPVVA